MDSQIQCLSSDMISNVPDDVLTLILARLSLKEAAQTSLLSKKWRNKWISIPKLDFDFTFSGLSKRDLFRIMFRLLLVHTRKITSFTLNVIDLKSCVAIDHLMLLLSKHHDLQEFTLNMDDTENEKRHVIASTLFSFEHLRRLELSNCVFRLPFAFEGFSHLKSIKFLFVDLQNLNFSRIMEGCPFLEFVVVFACCNLDSLVVGGPKLKYFDFSGHTRQLCFTMSPVLSSLELELELDIEEFMEGDGYVPCGDIVESFACLPIVSGLSMTRCILPYFGRGPIPACLPTTLESLKSLTLTHINCDILKDVSLVLCLLRSSPNLHRLRIQLWSAVRRYDGDAAADFIEPQDFSDTFSNLRVLTLVLFEGMKNDMLFLKLLLSKAPHLEHLRVDPQFLTIFSGMKIRMFESLKQLVGEASPKATFTFDK